MQVGDQHHAPVPFSTGKLARLSTKPTGGNPRRYWRGGSKASLKQRFIHRPPTAHTQFFQPLLHNMLGLTDPP